MPSPWGMNDLELDEPIDLAHAQTVIVRFYRGSKGGLGLDQHEGTL